MSSCSSSFCSSTATTLHCFLSSSTMDQEGHPYTPTQPKRKKRPRSPSSLVVAHQDQDQDQDQTEEWCFEMEPPNNNNNNTLSDYGWEATKVRFIDDPYSSLLVAECSSSYITINANEESCGSSFSDSGTSLMAGISSFTPLTLKNLPHKQDGFEMEMDGCDYPAFDVLAAFLDEDEQRLLPLNSHL